jgi:hypothetical protein
MGLILQARKIQKSDECVPRKKKIGLLDRARVSSAYDRVIGSFQEYLSSIACEKGGLVVPSPEGEPVFILPTGFDLTTTRRFCPDFSSLRREFPEYDHWYGKRGSEIEDYRTFFSSREADSLVSLFFCPINRIAGNDAYIVIAESGLSISRDKIIPSSNSIEFEAFVGQLRENGELLSVLSRVSSVNQSMEVIHERVKSALDAERKATFVSITLSALFPDELDAKAETEDLLPFYYAMINKLARQAGSTNIVRIRDNHDMRLVLFSAQSIDTDLYFSQLLKPLERLFGARRVSKIRMKNVGIGTDISSVTGFLFGER